MQIHTKIYMNAFGLDIIEDCKDEINGTQSIDTHHISPKRMGGNPKKDNIFNLMALNSTNHDAAHNHGFSEMQLYIIHFEKMLCEISKEKLLSFKSQNNGEYWFDFFTLVCMENEHLQEKYIEKFDIND